MKISEEQQLIQLKISCLKMVNGLIAFTYVVIAVWGVSAFIQLITG